MQVKHNRTHVLSEAHLRSSSSTVNRRSLSTKPTSTLCALGCSATLSGSSKNALDSSSDLRRYTSGVPVARTSTCQAPRSAELCAGIRLLPSYMMRSQQCRDLDTALVKKSNAGACRLMARTFVNPAQGRWARRVSSIASQVGHANGQACPPPMLLSCIVPQSVTCKLAVRPGSGTSPRGRDGGPGRRSERGRAPVLVVPQAQRAVQRAGGHQRLAHAGGHAGRLGRVEGMRHSRVHVLVRLRPRGAPAQRPALTLS